MMNDSSYEPRERQTVHNIVDPNTSDPSLQAFIEVFNGLTVENRYPGVMVNPIQCLVDELDNDLTYIGNNMGYIVGLYPEDPTVSQDWTNINYNNNLNDINLDLEKIEDHTDRMSFNLDTLAGIAQAGMAIDTIMNLMSNPCLGLDKFLGSIKDKGKQIMNNALNSVKPLFNSVKNLIDNSIKPAINEIKGLISNIGNMMSSVKQQLSSFIDGAIQEVLNFAKSMLQELRRSLADFLKNLLKDPCMKSLIKSVMTGGAAALL